MLASVSDEQKGFGPRMVEVLFDNELPQGFSTFPAAGFPCPYRRAPLSSFGDETFQNSRLGAFSGTIDTFEGNKHSETSLILPAYSSRGE
jgi:hypothetical protein